MTTTSFLSPNFARASRSALTPPMLGSLKFENCLNAETAVAAARSSRSWRAMAERPAAAGAVTRGGGWAAMGVVSGRRAGVAGASPASYPLGSV